MEPSWKYITNDSYRIKNPLTGIPQHTLLQNVADFAQEHGLSDITDVLQRGALVAQNPAEFENVEGLREEEREALRNEVLHKWRQPRAMYFTVVLCSVGAAVQGWDQTVSPLTQILSTSIMTVLIKTPG